MADVYCMLALDLTVFRLFSAAELRIGATTKHISATSFTEKAMAEDIKRYLY
jgi:hypothetical protein